MNRNLPTLAVYGIQDRENYEQPLTARFQTLFNRNDKPFLFDLLTSLDNNFDIKALINSSFNNQGEPIVYTENDALQAAKKMKLNGVVLNGKYIRLMNPDTKR